MKNQTPLLTVPSQSSLRKHAFYGVLALVSLLGLGITQPARANFIETINQVGTDVVASGSGTINLAGLALFETSHATSGIVPNQAISSVGSPAFEPVDVYTGFSGPSSFGSGVGQVPSNIGSGDKVDLLGGIAPPHLLAVPSGYLTGTLLSGTATYTGATFASLGIAPGTYTWTWGTGMNADSFTLQIGPASVPDAGSTLPLLGCALLGVAVLRRKLRC